VTRRLTTIVALVTMIATLTSGCGREHLTDANRLRAIMATTARLPHRFVYTETTSRAKISVQGAVEDAFRYKAAVSLDGNVAMEEVVRDDALADRFIENAAFGIFVRKAQAPTGGTVVQASPGGVAPNVQASPEVVQALTAQQWVIDPVGAPSLLASASEKHPLGADPIFDSLTAFRYVELAIREAARVKKFNADDLDYKPKEDPFPKPGKASGVDRYDLERSRLPRPQDVAGASANQVIPSTRHFRKMAVYVKNGRVIQILEQVDVESRLRDLQKNYDVKIPASLPLNERIDVAIESINAVRRGQGIEPIRVRTMSLQFLDLGKPNHVTLPDAPVKGSLAAFQNRGRSTTQADAAAAGTTPATGPPDTQPSETTVTTTAP
jgi:PBP1b-binding outer membrane lipoprotein LpoB